MWVENIKDFWYSWNIRLLILFSLLAQILLVICAPYRQKSRNTILRFSVWSTYLIADWIALYAIGLISNTKSDPSKGSKNILAFWAAFLLLHLGGPDGITSYSVEDNQLWLRRLFQVIAKVIAAAYILFQTFPGNNLWFPTILVLVVGATKYGERLAAMYLADLKRFGSTTLPKPNPGYDYEESVAKRCEMRSVTVKVDEELPQIAIAAEDHTDKPSYKGITLEDQDDDMERLRLAYSLFEDFKGLLVGYILNPSDQKSSRNLFLRSSAELSFRLAEYELSLMYQLLHTKVSVVFNRVGLIIRLLCLGSMVVAYISFHLLVGKDKVENFELIFSYVLVGGAIFVDIMSGITLCFSDWLLIYIYHESWKKHIPATAMPIYRRLVVKGWSAKVSKKMNSIRGSIFEGRSWSRSVSQYNMITLCVKLNKLEKRPCSGCSKIPKLDVFWYPTPEEKNIEDLKGLIFEELINRPSSTSDDDAMEACPSRGGWALKDHFKLQWSIREFHYAESLLLWHLAAELCYQADPPSYDTTTDEKTVEKTRKVLCKIISDYMFYLLAKKSELLAPVLGNIWEVVYQDTLEEAKAFFSKHFVTDYEQACEKLRNVKAKYRPAQVKGNSSKSVLFDACILASQLQSLGEKQWEIMSKVLVELLCYSAINCQAIVHAQQLRKGGELLTLTWLLMNHLGLGSQPQEQDIKI